MVTEPVRALITVLSAVILVLRAAFEFIDDAAGTRPPILPPPIPPSHQSIGTLPPKDKYGEIRGTAFWKHYSGISEGVFDRIENRLHDRLYEARNIHFEHGLQQNRLRRRRPCKISNRNRILHFLHQMRTGQILWDAALDYGWNRNSSHMDFYHVLWHFVDEFKSEIGPMPPFLIASMQGTWSAYPNAYQALDGCQFLCTRSKVLPGQLRRRDVYCWKKRHPEGRNVQAVVSQFGHCTALKIGPGAMNDAAMSRSMCLADGIGSTLVDDGYSRQRMEFVLPDGSEEHASCRGVVERYFGRVKVTWKMVGRIYGKQSKQWFDMVIWAAFILTNMNVLESNGLNPRQ